MIERRNTPVPATLEERGEGEQPQIVGRAAVFYDGTEATEFELWEGMRERIMPKSFDRALKESDDVRGLFNHNPDMILGRTAAKTLMLNKTKQGLDYRIIPGQTTVASDTIESLRRGDVTGSSFAFRVTDQTWKTIDGIDIREIRGVELFDVGPVTYPAYEATTAGLRSEGYLDEARKAHAAWKDEQKAQAHNQSILMKIKGFEA